MGTWTLLETKSQVADRPHTLLHGSNWAVRFKLKYTPSRFGSFKEMPKLEWKETITMVEQRKGTYWVQPVDQYARNPGSPTFTMWRNRYVNMHNAARQGSPPIDTMHAGFHRIYDINGRPLGQNDLARLNTNKEKADAVRSYFQRHGGVAEIWVLDLPSINKPKDGKDVCKERLLTFDCGLAGHGHRIIGWQYLTVDSAIPESKWARKCEATPNSPRINISGLRQVAAPTDVSEVKPKPSDPSEGLYS